MSIFKNIYFIGILLVTLAIIIIYIIQERKHKHELDKINRLEREYDMEQKRLSKIRLRSDPCPTPNLNSPRTCYFQSNYKCSWNERGKRCDLRS